MWRARALFASSFLFLLSITHASIDFRVFIDGVEPMPDSNRAETLFLGWLNCVDASIAWTSNMSPRESRNAPKNCADCTPTGFSTRSSSSGSACATSRRSPIGCAKFGSGADPGVAARRRRHDDGKRAPLRATTPARRTPLARPLVWALPPSRAKSRKAAWASVTHVFDKDLRHNLADEGDAPRTRGEAGQALASSKKRRSRPARCPASFRCTNSASTSTARSSSR